MIEQAKKNCVCSKDYLVMVVDAQSLKVFSSSCKFYELYQQKLYHIEMIDRKRKKYPKTDAIYFITPTKRSVQRLVEDFEKTDSKGATEQLLYKP